MGSDYHMNPPKPIYDTYSGLNEDDAMGYVLGALVNKKAVTLSAPSIDGTYTVRIHTGKYV